MKKWISLMIVLAMTAMLGGCNTIHGFGRDVEKVGDKIQEKSAK